MTKMRGGLNLIPKILKKHDAGRAVRDNPTSNGKQAKKRANLSAKNKANAKNSSPQTRANERRRDANACVWSKGSRGI